MKNKVKSKLISKILIMVVFCSAWMPALRIVAESQETIQDGTYDVAVCLLEQIKDNASAENEVVEHANLVVKDGKAKLLVSLKPLKQEKELSYVVGFQALKNVRLTSRGTVSSYSYGDIEVLEEYDVIDKYNESGAEFFAGEKYPRVVSFEVSLGQDYIWVEVTRPATYEEQDYSGFIVRLSIDWTKLYNITTNLESLNAIIVKAEKLNANDYTKASYQKVTAAVSNAKELFNKLMVTQDEMIKAKEALQKSMAALKLVPYTITYKLASGKNNSANPTTYTKDQQIILKNPTRQGYVFAGWYTSSSYKTPITKIAKGTAKNISVYAKWTKVTVPVTRITYAKSSSVKKATVKWKPVAGAAGYEIIYSRSIKFPAKASKTVTSKTNSVTLKTSCAGVKYYVKVRAYKLDSTKKKVIGKYSNPYGVKIYCK